MPSPVPRSKVIQRCAAAGPRRLASWTPAVLLLALWALASAHRLSLLQPSAETGCQEVVVTLATTARRLQTLFPLAARSLLRQATPCPFQVRAAGVWRAVLMLPGAAGASQNGRGLAWRADPPWPLVQVWAFVPEADMAAARALAPALHAEARRRGRLLLLHAVPDLGPASKYLYAVAALGGRPPGWSPTPASTLVLGNSSDAVAEQSTAAELDAEVSRRTRRRRPARGGLAAGSGRDATHDKCPPGQRTHYAACSPQPPDTCAMRAGYPAAACRGPGAGPG